MLNIERLRNSLPRSSIRSFKDQHADQWLEGVEGSLNGIIGAIQQIPNRRARQLTSIAIGKLGGVATVGGIASMIATFGTASTGTAIASLSGAAATGAQLYWIGYAPSGSA